LSNQTFGKWLGDALKNLAVSVVGGLLFLWGPYLLLKKSPRRWWLYTSLLSLPFLIFVTLIAPVWIDPLFNDFGPMQDKAIETKVLALAERAGIEGGRVYQVNKSVDTSAVNAYVTGFSGTKRIVFWDTILSKLNDRELLVVVGHEMGHYVLRHIITGIIVAFLLIFISLYLAYRLSGGMIRRYKDRFGFDRLADIASLPLLLLLVSVFSYSCRRLHWRSAAIRSMRQTGLPWRSPGAIMMRRPHSSSCSRKILRFPGRAFSTSCGAPRTLPSASASTSAMSTGRGVQASRSSMAIAFNPCLGHELHAHPAAGVVKVGDCAAGRNDPVQRPRELRGQFHFQNRKGIVQVGFRARADNRGGYRRLVFGPQKRQLSGSQAVPAGQPCDLPGCGNSTLRHTFGQPAAQARRP
jgi:hypothetical protein